MSKWIKKLTEAYSEVNINENKKMATAKALAKSTASSEKGKAAVTLPKAPFDIPKKADKMPIAKKDVNELNKSTLGSYIKKAADDGAMKKHKDVNIYKAMGDDENAAKVAKKAKNRTAGIATAVDKLAKEAMDPVNHKALKGKHKDRDDTDIDNDGDTDSTDKYLHKRRKAISKNVKDGDEVEMNPKLKKKEKGTATANGDAGMAESTLPSVYARILENRAAHYKKAAPAQDKEDGLSPMAKKAKADMEAGAKMDDTEEKGHVDAAKAGRAGPGRKPRRNDNMKGDKSVIPSATKMKEAFAAVYDTSTSPLIFEKTSSLKVNRSTIGHSADELGGSGSLGHGAHDLMHPDQDGGASAYGHVDKKTKKFKAVQVKFGHSTSAQKVAKAMGHKEVGPHHKAIADYHNETNAAFMGQKAGDSHSVKEAFLNESARALPKGYVDHETIKDNQREYGDGVNLGHGTHEIEHPHEPGGSGRASMKGPSHPHAYAHHDKKTGKVTAIEIKHQKTSAAAVAKAMGHKEVGAPHHAIADHHNETNLDV